jgi:hypothetical protein
VLQHVVLEGFAAHEFAGTALLKTLGGSLAGFELWHKLRVKFFQLAQSIILVPGGDRLQLFDRLGRLRAVQNPLRPVAFFQEGAIMSCIT